MTSDSVFIRLAKREDWPALWAILEPVFRAGETYAIDRDISETDAQTFWLDLPTETYIAELDGQLVGTYMLKANQSGDGQHVANCGYIVDPAARGKGIARALCEHSQAIAKTRGFRAMQFNFVVASNQGAITLWRRLGFEEVGRLPNAFEHPILGLVDALIFYKWLDD